MQQYVRNVCFLREVFHKIFPVSKHDHSRTKPTINQLHELPLEFSFEKFATIVLLGSVETDVQEIWSKVKVKIASDSQSFEIHLESNARRLLAVCTESALVEVQRELNK